MNERVLVEIKLRRPITALVVIGSLAALLLTPLLAPLTPRSVYAQDGKRQNGDKLSWADAPIVPRYRSEADWLIDVGRKTPAEVYGPFPTHEYHVGETEQFFPLGMRSDAQVFELRARTEHAYFWLETGVFPDAAMLDYTTRFFEEHIWPLNHSIYGDEWNPGIDGDSRIHILSQRSIAWGVMGAFSPQDQCPRALCPESNQREIIYIGLDAAPLGSPEYLTTLAHEHQHLIQYHVDGNERRWFNEGLSQLAEHLNGFPPRTVGEYSVTDFLEQPDHHLNGWSFNGYDVGRYYGASYLFLVYLYERFGLEFIRWVVHTDYDGLAAVQAALDAAGQDVDVDAVFADWLLANYLDDPYVGDGHYYYQSLDLPGEIHPLPLVALRTDTVQQYGADYLALDDPGTYYLTFDGTDSVSAMSAVPHSGDWMWWSYNLDSSAARLTGSFDLTGLDSATLAFSAWWNVEDEYDWFQVLVSGNAGQDWTIMDGQQSTSTGPKAPGAYYSGRSAAWVDEQIDLSAFAGGPVLVRFEYLTDGSQTMPGVALDDIGIAELAFADDVETVLPVWQVEGFLRIPDVVPQNWTVALVEHDAAGGIMVRFLVLDDLNTGGTTVTVPDGGRVTVIVGAMAPFTAIPASYKLSVQRAG
ncbi:MAG: immune inhibitor A [Anaerolineae bacterium]|nr:immune inhibitor A [Anaerolineae bacterium]